MLEPSGPVQACNGTDLPLPLPLGTRRKLDFHEFKDRIADGLCYGVICEAF